MMIFTHTLPIFVLLFFITVVVVPEVNDTKGTCYILHQSIVCNSVNVTHLDSVKEILDNASSEYPNFGFICNHCNLQGFPDDILKDFNITTFGFIPHEVQPDSFPYLDILKNINSKLTHLYLLGGSVTSSDFQKLKEFHFGDTLKFLDLRYNKLDAIDSETFAGWNQLEEINLLGNKISNVRRHAFKGLDNLRKVDLSKNIITLEDEAFYELPSLTHLDFSSANISVIPKRAFVNLKSLKSLILQFNGISTVEKETFNTENFPNISELNLTGLPFICECDLQWFKKWLKKRKLLEDSGATCIFPIPLSKFSETNFCLDGYEEDAVEIEDDDEDEEDTDEPDTGNKEEL